VYSFVRREHRRGRWPAIPPEALRPLLKAYEMGTKHLAKECFAEAVKEALAAE